MPNYKTMYNKLFAAQTDALLKLEEALVCLEKAQQETEEIYLNSSECRSVRLSSLSGKPPDPAKP